MLSFHGDIEIKKKYVARTEAHRKADEIIHGTGWENGKGCAVGCTLEAYVHSRYPIELGLPEWLAHVEDALFEGMSSDRATLWPTEFLLAVPVGVTEEQFERNVKAPFLVMVLESALKSFDNAAYPDVTKAVKSSIALWQRDDIGSPAFLEAALATQAATEAAAWAAEAAGAAAQARKAAARATQAATEAEAQAAWAAGAAAAEAARAARAARATAWAARAARATAWAAAAAAAAAAEAARAAGAAAEAARAAGAAAAEAEAGKYAAFSEQLLILLENSNR